MTNKDPDVEALFNFGMTMNFTASQYAILTKIIDKTVQHKLQEFAEQFIKLSPEDMIKELREMTEEQNNKTGLWQE